METLIKTSTLVLTRVGEHHMDGGLYRDENGNYYVDLHNEPEDGEVATLYRLSPTNEPDGEPDRKVVCTVEFTNPQTEREKREKHFRFEYMLLSRLVSDIQAYFGSGNEEEDKWDCRYHNEKNIWGTTIESHIAKMKELWQKFPEDLKPEWCTWEQILDYEKKSLS